jgi:hypothetical protein
MKKIYIMKRLPLFAILLGLGILVVVACQKTNNANSSLSVNNLSGTYGIKAVTWTFMGATVNVYDSFPACEKDNLIKLNQDLTVNYIDTGMVCTPSESVNGNWALKGDSIYISTTLQTAKIKSFDGKTLVLTGSVDSTNTITGTTTLQKQ